MTFKELEQGLAEARLALDQLDRISFELAKLLSGRLRTINKRGYHGSEHEILKTLKSELRAYHVGWGRWVK